MPDLSAKSLADQLRKIEPGDGSYCRLEPGEKMDVILSALDAATDMLSALSMVPVSTALRDGSEFLARVIDRHAFSVAPECRWDIARWSGSHFQSRSGSIVTHWSRLPPVPEIKPRDAT